MGGQEIREKLAALPRKEQDEVIAYLFHLRRAGERTCQEILDRRLADQNSSHWFSPDEFERELDKWNTQ